jgi:hypothetical protein
MCTKIKNLRNFRVRTFRYASIIPTGASMMTFKSLMICIGFIWGGFYCFAQEEKNVAANDRFIETVIPTEWQKVAPEQYSEILNMLIKFFENNCEKIKTVQGEYTINYEQPIDLSELVRDSVTSKNSTDTLRRQNFNFRFACDNKAKKIFREKQIIDATFIDLSTQKVLKFDNISPLETSSIATPTDFIFSRHKTETSIAELTGFPEAMNTRVARRIPPVTGEESLVDKIDPMEYFDLKRWGNPTLFFGSNLR